MNPVGLDLQRAGALGALLRIADDATRRLCIATPTSEVSRGLRADFEDVQQHWEAAKEAHFRANVRGWRELLEIGDDTVTSALVDRQFRALAEGLNEESERFLELKAARDAALHELCFETDQTRWAG